MTFISYIYAQFFILTHKQQDCFTEFKSSREKKRVACMEKREKMDDNTSGLRKGRRAEMNITDKYHKCVTCPRESHRKKS